MKYVVSILKAAEVTTCFEVGSLLASFFDPENGGDMFLRKVG
jgi:hypothetical protein